MTLCFTSTTFGRSTTGATGAVGFAGGAFAMTIFLFVDVAGDTKPRCVLSQLSCDLRLYDFLDVSPKRLSYQI